MRAPDDCHFIKSLAGFPSSWELLPTPAELSPLPGRLPQIVADMTSKPELTYQQCTKM